jgi:hypothetical protein
MDATTNEDDGNERRAHDERRERITAIVDAVKAKHTSTQLYSVDSETADEFYVHRRASSQERRIYRKLIADDKRLDAQDALMGCVLYPDAAEFTKRRDEAPFIVETLCDAILAASGIYLDVVRKKL